MFKRLDDECPKPVRMPAGALQGLATGIFPASVYRCADPEEAEALLSGELDGYAYQRDGHPNADMLSQKCRDLHGAQWAVITSTGMAALSVATLGLLQSGHHIVVSDQLYGRTTQLLTQRWSQLGVEVTTVNPMDVGAVQAAMLANTQLIVVETLTNPMLRVAPIDQLARIAHAGEARLLVDNTFATPAVCQPLQHGADYVVESISKMMNGHSDVMLGMLCGHGDQLAGFRDTLSIWGMSSSPFDCWLALRGLATLHLRMERAGANAMHVADRLAADQRIAAVAYPGLGSHTDRDHVVRLFMDGMGGSMVSFQLAGGRDAARRFITTTSDLPFCPSLGEVSTTLSHPASTSHRGLTAQQRADLGIQEGTIRLSVGTESADWIWQTMCRGLDSLG